MTGTFGIFSQAGKRRSRATYSMVAPLEAHFRRHDEEGSRVPSARSAPLVVEAAPEEASPIRGWPTRARGDFCQFLNEKRADRGADWFRLRPLVSSLDIQDP